MSGTHHYPINFHVGQHVWANTGIHDFIGHIAKLAHDVGGETKYGIQTPGGTIVDMAYREPEDRDAGGSGLTFWKLA